ncbi:MAG: oligosaccharide flippase family protein [Flavobacteriales bacterium]|nr:oligosaccharide flippase family protein [Flavobacteriales bacterium]
MLKLIIRQANWGILGSVFAFVIGFFVKTYVIREVGTEEWGKYATAHTFAIIADTFLSISIPFIILKFFPDFINRSKDVVSQLIRKIFIYAFSISSIFLVSMIFLSPILDKYFYVKTDDFSYLLLVISIHVPISIFMGVIASLYRSVLKIKEIIIYGIFVSVPVRAILTFIVFQYTNNIMYFVAIEIFTQILTLSLLYYFFNKNEFRIFNIKKDPNFFIKNEVISYGKNMYANSLVSLLSTQSLSFILGVMLTPDKMGIYSILLSISALSMFLNKNLRQVFAPAVSKLFAENRLSELNSLYKNTTFIVNLFTVPFAILVCFFSDEILKLFASDSSLSVYKNYLFALIIGNMICLLSGNSKTFMIMAGMEKKELSIQLIRGVLSFVLALVLIREYELVAVVTLFIIFTIYVGAAQLISIKKEINISPFSKELLFLVIISLPIIWFSITQNYSFQFYHFIIVPIGLYLLYFSIFYKRIFNLYKKLK